MPDLDTDSLVCDCGFAASRRTVELPDDEGGFSRCTLRDGREMPDEWQTVCPECERTDSFDLLKEDEDD